MQKYIFITGGVLSSLGKGVVAASLGAILERSKLKIDFLKMDPYLSVDPGTMNPNIHGEVFVTEDGAETDLDLGHYERFTQIKVKKNNNFTSGKIYLEVIQKERQGFYQGQDVQLVPHVTDAIKEKIIELGKKCDVLLGEVGGTVGDLESPPFLEAIRQLSMDKDKKVIFIHMVYLPYLRTTKELKTKPAQHSVKELRSYGINPHFLFLRSEESSEFLVEKLRSNTGIEHILEVSDQDSIYKVPLILEKQHLSSKIFSLFSEQLSAPKLEDFHFLEQKLSKKKDLLTIAMICKYGLQESYKSLEESLNHSALSIDRELKIDYLSSDEELSHLQNYSGILVPGGFGKRGTEGKIKAIHFARTKQKPFLGICLGLQLAVIEFAQHVLNLKNATSEEFEEQGDFLIHYLHGQKELQSTGASMRLGLYPCELLENSLAQSLYQQKIIHERHRHRLEVNNFYRSQLEEKGLIFSGLYIKENLIEIIEVKNHPFFIACQFHPEFQSSPFKPHPLLTGFLKACLSSPPSSY